MANIKISKESKKKIEDWISKNYTITEIAKRLGVTRGTIYNNVRKKEKRSFLSKLFGRNNGRI